LAGLHFRAVGRDVPAPKTWDEVGGLEVLFEIWGGSASRKEPKGLKVEQALIQKERADKAGIGAKSENRFEPNGTDPHMSTICKLVAIPKVHTRALTKGSDDG
jgi:hypothetical protein